MKIEIDQSNKVEDSGDTILGFSNSISYSICIPFAVKHKGLQALRERGKTNKRSKLLLFAACVYLLIKEFLSSIDFVIIDNEYDGHEADIRSFVYEYIRRTDTTFPITNISVSEVTKKSPAHTVAWSAFRGKRKVDRVIRMQELLEEVA